jgi:hypothetical protein
MRDAEIDATQHPYVIAIRDRAEKQLATPAPRRFQQPANDIARSTGRISIVPVTTVGMLLKSWTVPPMS